MLITQRLGKEKEIEGVISIKKVQQFRERRRSFLMCNSGSGNLKIEGVEAGF